LKIKLSAQDISEAFEYLDVSRDGALSYTEFCNLCEERRKHIDPFEAPYQRVITKKKTPLPKAFGVTSLPSDSMTKIITHDFEKEHNAKLLKRFS
jgi:hypothetical protein